MWLMNWPIKRKDYLRKADEAGVMPGRRKQNG